MNVSYGLLPAGESYLYDVLERKLEKQSEKGWMAEYIGVFLIKYRKCEPKRRKVQIVYDPDNMEFESNKTEYSQGLEYYVENSGWVKACEYNKQKIYYNDDINAVPIYTDDREKLKSIDDSMAGLKFANLLMLTLIFFFALLLGDGFIGLIKYATLRTAALAVAILFVPIYLLVTTIMYEIWKYKSEKNLEMGLGLASTKPSRIANIVMYILAAVILVLMVVSHSEDGMPGSLPKVALVIVLFLIMVPAERRVGVALKNRKAGYFMISTAMFIVYFAIFILINVIGGRV